MLCSRAQNLLSAYCDYELTGAEMLAIREHLEGCPSCAREYASLRQVKSLLRALPQAEACRSFAPGMLEEGPRRRLQTPWINRMGASFYGFRRSAYHLATGAVLGLSILAVSALQKPNPPTAAGARIPVAISAEQEPAEAALTDPHLPLLPVTDPALTNVGIEPVVRFHPNQSHRYPAEYGYYVVTYPDGISRVIPVSSPVVRFAPMSLDLNGR
jgi:hypothetical protein